MIIYWPAITKVIISESSMKRNHVTFQYRDDFLQFSLGLMTISYSGMVYDHLSLSVLGRCSSLFCWSTLQENTLPHTAIKTINDFTVTFLYDWICLHFVSIFFHVFLILHVSYMRAECFEFFTKILQFGFWGCMQARQDFSGSRRKRNSIF